MSSVLPTCPRCGRKLSERRSVRTLFGGELGVVTCDHLLHDLADRALELLQMVRDMRGPLPLPIFSQFPQEELDRA